MVHKKYEYWNNIKKYRICQLQSHNNKQLFNNLAKQNMIHIGTHSIQNLNVLSNFTHVNWTYVWTIYRISQSYQFELGQRLNNQVKIKKEKLIISYLYGIPFQICQLATKT